MQMTNMFRARVALPRIVSGCYRLFTGDIQTRSSVIQFRTSSHFSSLSRSPRVEHPKDYSWLQRIQPCRHCSKNNGKNNTTYNARRNGKSSSNGQKKDAKNGNEENLTVFQRFKKTYKEHGKILVGVHIVTSTVWFGSFFYTVSSGVDVIGILERMGASEKILKPFRSSNLGNVAIAYLMYKLATPARYTVTLAGTNFVIRYLRSKGKLKPIQEQDKIRHLYREGTRKMRTRGKNIRGEFLKNPKLKSRLHSSQMYFKKSKLFFLTRRDKMRIRLAKGRAILQKLRARYSRKEKGNKKGR